MKNQDEEEVIVNYKAIDELILKSFTFEELSAMYILALKREEEKDEQVIELQSEVAKRNQYRINEDYLNNIHAHYEKTLREKDEQIKKMKVGISDEK